MSILVLSSIALSVSAEIYKWVDDEGNIHYGEKPPSVNTKEEVKTIKIRDNVDTQRAAEALNKKSKSLNDRSEERKKEKTDGLFLSADLAEYPAEVGGASADAIEHLVSNDPGTKTNTK